MPFVSVEEILRLALPTGTLVLAGRAGLDREVSWAAALRARAPVLPSLRGGELVLVSMAALQQIDPPVPLEGLVQRLSERGVSGLVVLGEVSALSLSTADELRMPMLALPPGVNLHDLEGFVTRTITERRAELYRQGTKIQRTLAGLTIDGRGLSGIVKGLSDLIGKPVVLESDKLEVQVVAGTAELTSEVVTRLFADTMGKRRYDFPPSEPLAHDPPVVRYALGQHGLHLFVSPVFVREQVAGYVSAVGGEADLGDLDRLGVAHGASACALEMAKQRAVIEAENRLRGSFLEELLSGPAVDRESVSARARYLGWNVEQAHVVAVFRLDDDSTANLPTSDVDPRHVLEYLEAEIRLWSPGALLQMMGDSITVLYGVETGQTVHQVRSAVEQSRRNASDRLSGRRVSAGIGRVRGDLAELSASRGEAVQALAIAQGLLGGGCTADFSELGVYRLLYPLKGKSELKELYEEVLGPVGEYDGKHDSELLRTLESFFACQGSLQKTAEELFLHRNTLAYRLRRIEELTGLDLNDLEDRFLLHLALKIRRVL